MQNFPVLNESEFIKTRKQIHSVAKIIGKFREELATPIAKNDNLYLKVVEQGFCTPPIVKHNDLEIGFSPEKMIVEIANASDKYSSVSINGKTQKTLFEELVKILSSEFNVNTQIDSGNFDSLNIISIDENNAYDFLVQLVNFNFLLTDFWKRINTGVKTQICLWPHHFDNAFRWFSGRKIDEKDEEMGIGVSSGDDTYELPYIYITFWPPLRKTNTLQIPDAAVLHDKEWTGLILPYESIADQKTFDKQKTLIDNFFDVSFASVTRAFSKR